MIRSHFRLMGLLAVAFAAVWIGTAVGASDLNIAGTGASQDILRAVAKAFTAENPGITVKVPDSTGSGGGVKAAGEGRAALGRVARGIKEKEKGYGLKYLAFAKVPVVFVVNPSVTGVSNLTAAQTVDIFSGKTTNWKDLGGPNARIRVVTRYAGDSTLDLIRKSVPGWDGLEITKRSKATETDQSNIQVLKETEGTVGFATSDIAKAAGMTLLSLDGISPDAKGYPIAVELALVYKPGALKGVPGKFVDFLFSGEGARIIREAGGVPTGR